MFLVKDVIYNNIYNIFIKIYICYYDTSIYIILIAYSIKDDVIILIIDNSSTINTINLVKLLQQDRSTKMREREINLSLIKGCDILIPKTVKNNIM